MRDVPLSNCERDFILQAISQRKRLDGREAYDYRKIKITFGVERGCCSVELGKTRVMAQVSCEVTQPKPTRPSEGVLYVNIELSPMASPAFESGRLSEGGVEINRLLERCIKESRCLDLESLCIVSGEKVWQIRVDVHVLNHEGNLVDGASIAAITALSHFRRPDVTVESGEVIIHSAEDKDPVPLSVHHMPICVTFAFFQQGKFLLVDPAEKEERVMDGKMVIGMNKHREICTLQMSGEMLLLKEQVIRCSNIAVVKVAEISELIQLAIENDSKARAAGEKFGFAESVEKKKQITVSHANPIDVDMEDIADRAHDIVNAAAEEEEEEDSDVEIINPKVSVVGPGTGQIGMGGKNTWLNDDNDDDDDDDDIQEVAVVRKPQFSITSKLPPPQVRPELPKPKPPAGRAKAEEFFEVSSGSEEEEVITLDEDDLDCKVVPKEKVVLTKDEIDLTKALKKMKKMSAKPPKAENKKKKKSKEKA